LRYMVDAETAERVAADTELPPAPPSSAPPPTSTHTVPQPRRPATGRRAGARGRALVGRAGRCVADRSVEAITFAVRSIVSAAREFDWPEPDAGDLVLAAFAVCISVGIGVAVASVM
jgi:hypothetical protein